MNRTRAWVVAGAGLIAQLALPVLSGLLPDGVRVVLAFALLVLWPGFAALRLMGEQPPGGAWLAAGWALALGVLWNALLLSATAALRLPFTDVLVISPLASAALWSLVALRAARERREVGPEGDRLRGVALAALLAATLLAALHAGLLGARLTFDSDSPDHIGTLRRMLEHGVLFPTDAFYRDAGAAGIDPRKFLWHGVVALSCALARVGALEGWRDLAAVAAPLFVLNVAALGVLVGGGGGAAVAAWVLVLTYGGSLENSALRDAGNAAKMADQLSLAACVAVLADLARGTRGSRVAAVAIAAAAAATHVFAAFQLGVVLAALGVALAVLDRGWSARLARLTMTSAAMLAAAAPFALWQVLRTPPPLNLLHIEPQGLMTLWGSVRVVAPGVLWDWMGTAWLLFPLLLVPLWRARTDGVPVLFLLTTTLAAGIVMFFPPAFGILHPRLGYLLMRVVWIMPLAALAAWAFPRYAARLRVGPARPRIAAAAMLALISLPLIPGARNAIGVPLRWPQMAREERALTPLPWRADLARADSLLGPGHVVLSDPVTSYSVPMLSRQYVVTMLDQHSPPTDPNAVRRLIDARDALDPYADWSVTRGLLRRYGADAIVLNDRFRAIPSADYWSPRPEWYAAERARLASHPEVFEPLVDRPDFAVYRVHGDALDALSGTAPPRPYVAAFRPGEEPIGHRIGAGLPEFLGLTLAPAVAAPGDTLTGQIRWRGAGTHQPGSYQVAVRFDRPLPWGVDPPAFLGKPVRKLLEKMTHRLYRFREDHLPVAGDYGVDLWNPDQVVRDSFRVAVPRTAASGRYAVRVHIRRQPHYPNLRLSDYFFDQDMFAGVMAGEIAIEAPPGPERDADRNLAPRGGSDVRH